MRRILFQVHGIQWFSSVPNDNRKHQLGTLVERHLESLPGLDDRWFTPVAPKVLLLEGDWSILHQGRWGIDPYNAWGDRWKAADESIGRIIRYLIQVVNSSPDARLLLRPPLWPVAHHINICGQTIIADSDLLNKAGVTPGGRDWCVAWALLCRAEACIWHALLWELALGVRVIQGPNPFQYLLDMYELRTFPMGWADNCYELYAPKTPIGAAVTSTAPSS